MYNVKQNDRSVSLTKDKQIRMLADICVCCVCVQFIDNLSLKLATLFVLIYNAYTVIYTLHT